MGATVDVIVIENLSEAQMLLEDYLRAELLKARWAEVSKAKLNGLLAKMSNPEKGKVITLDDIQLKRLKGSGLTEDNKKYKVFIDVSETHKWKEGVQYVRASDDFTKEQKKAVNQLVNNTSERRTKKVDPVD